jgi:hypothetical protein
MDAPEPETVKLVDEVKTAFAANDAHRVRAILNRHPPLKMLINQPVGPFDSPAIVNVCSREMLDVLLDAGADINARSRWWAGGFGLLDSAEAELAAYAIARGAIVDAHAAARLDMLDRLRELVSKGPSVVHARGGDGQTPLHFARTIEEARYLLNCGADIDARDVDHESTPAQYMVKERQHVARYLVTRGCRTDLLMATALGDLDLARRHLDVDPGCVRTRVHDEFFPMVDARAGGTIYQWTLGFHGSAHQVARKFGHQNVLTLLLERTPVDANSWTRAGWLTSRRFKRFDASTPGSLRACQKVIAVRWRTPLGTTRAPWCGSCWNAAGPLTREVSIKRCRCIGPRFTATPRWRRRFSVSIRRSRQPTLTSMARHSDGQSMDPSTGGTAGQATTAPPSRH